METATLAAIGGLILAPFGAVDGLLAKQSPWRGFDAQGPNLTVVRLERIGAACPRWATALEAETPGFRIKPDAALADQPEALRAWEPWTEDEMSDIRGCTKFPCNLKMNESEVGQMKSVPETARTRKFLEIVGARAARYLKTQERREYEFPGDPVEPWKYLESKGFKGDAPAPGAPELWIREVDLAPGKAKVIHQVADRRVLRQKGGVTVWLRDAYADHFFDGWGEWTQVRCEEGQAGAGVLLQALFGELDLLKQNDLVSRLMRGKMRSSFESQGGMFLEQGALRLRSAAGQGSVAPSPGPAPLKSPEPSGSGDSSGG